MTPRTYRHTVLMSEQVSFVLELRRKKIHIIHIREHALSRFWSGGWVGNSVSNARARARTRVCGVHMEYNFQRCVAIGRIIYALQCSHAGAPYWETAGPPLQRYPQTRMLSFMYIGTYDNYNYYADFEEYCPTRHESSDIILLSSKTILPTYINVRCLNHNINKTSIKLSS